MKTAEARDEMVARVKTAFAEHPTYASWDVPTSEPDFHERLAMPGDQAAYVELLHRVCALGVPIGRTADGLAGKLVE